MFLLTLGPYASSLNQVITSIRGLAQLDKGVSLIIQGEIKQVYVYILAFIKDILQQQDNASFL